MTLCSPTVDTLRRKAVWGPKRTLAALLIAAFGFGFATTASAAGPGRFQNANQGSRHNRNAPHKRPGAPGFNVKNYKMDDEVTKRSARGNPLSTTSVIVTLVPGAKLPPEFKKWARKDKLDIINGQVLDLPENVLKQLAKHPDVFRIHENRPIGSHNYRTSITTGADVVHDYLGYTGLGIGVAIIDSGVASWHDDLTRGGVNKTFPYGDQRVAKFVDFVGTKTTPYDDNGHGTHVAGIIAGNGYDSNGEKAGIAPKALDHLAEGARRERPGHDRQHHRRAELGRREPRDLQHPRREHVGRRQHQRVVSDRPVDARDQARDRPRHHRRDGRGQSSGRTRSASSSTAASRRPATRPGC